MTSVTDSRVWGVAAFLWFLETRGDLAMGEHALSLTYFSCKIDSHCTVVVS